MSDPLGELENSLAYMFELQTKKTGKCIHPDVQRLKNALDNYKKGPSISLQELVTAVKQALPVIVNYGVELYVVKMKMNALAEEKGSSINWDLPVTQSRYRPQFQFAASLRVPNNDFITWLSSRADKDFSALDSHAQVEILIAERGEREFTTKLAEHLRNEPHFLLDLIMTSPEIFNPLMETRIGFQLENQQIAKAICHHYLLEMAEQDSFQQLEEKLLWLDNLLAKTGRSMEKLLADPLAKAELDKSPVYQLYMNTEQAEQDFSPDGMRLS
ncbi:Uncharacterised protein [Legionella donaldsonii]|uniref:Uncharacterized protein n=1 Tax=Legionella donaldsonii TaxID=45060 RepID=A0A378J4T0_9GAMM|nr:hypothetical protein [Legionella donaldsonii]STX42742.1 Uncharacterised protein [Legionella donaldsonii]